MKIKELIETLQQFDQGSEIMIQDDLGPREINVWPYREKITEVHAEDCADCEDLVGQVVVVIGYGSY